jgi:hypothetical protein
MPPLYLVTIGRVIGDALGNLKVFVPTQLATAVGLAAAAMFLLDSARPT